VHLLEEDDVDLSRRRQAVVRAALLDHDADDVGEHGEEVVTRRQSGRDAHRRRGCVARPELNRLLLKESAGGQREVVGEAEITEVTDKQSRAKLSGDARPLPAGLKAIERS